MASPDLSFRLSALIVCVNYWDFLQRTLPLNREHFNEIIVVTTPGDDRTKQVCADLDVRCCVTDEFYVDNAPFNKGRAINHALHGLTDPSWVALMDADIVLPPTFRQRVSTSGLDPAKLYTCDRYICDTPDLWDKIRRGASHLYHRRPYPAEDFLYIPQWDQITKRLSLPLGYLQIAHYGGILSELGYPTSSDDANWSDVEFSQCYPAGDRVWIEGMRVIHLGTTGVNEKGLIQPAERTWS
jgi:glycosyltransferase involved in cell wall biosynthesis